MGACSCKDSRHSSSVSRPIRSRSLLPGEILEIERGPTGISDVEIALVRLELTEVCHEGVSNVDASAVIGCEVRLR